MTKLAPLHSTSAEPEASPKEREAKAMMKLKKFMRSPDDQENAPQDVVGLVAELTFALRSTLTRGPRTSGHQRLRPSAAAVPPPHLHRFSSPF